MRKEPCRGVSKDHVQDIQTSYISCIKAIMADDSVNTTVLHYALTPCHLRDDVMMKVFNESSNPALLEAKAGQTWLTTKSTL
ncbi:hypothetical protein J1614_007455 [Plenodomus biglobosus]|nr:hypothetical protein J1614_007455 [Plenodomus biglobosus]